MPNKKAPFLLFLLSVYALSFSSCKAILIRHVFNGYHQYSGQEFPNLQVAKEDGTHTELYAYKGKAVYLNIWATWCKPCIEDFTYIQKMNTLITPYKDIVIINLCVNGPKEQWLKMIHEHPETGLQLFLTDTSKYAFLLKRFKIEDKGFPSFFILDSSDTIQGSNIGPDQGILTTYCLVQAQKKIDTRTAAYNFLRLSKEMKQKDNAETKEFVDFLTTVSAKQ